MKGVPYYFRLFFLIAGLFSSSVVQAQLMNHYWSLNFNSQSSLISGAVVAGDGGNTSIYYNPSTISEIDNGGNLSLATSLFTWGIYYFNNALGDGIDINYVNFNVQPQFLSYSFRPKNSKFAFAVSAITRMKERLDLNYYNSEEKDVISSTPGTETYYTSFRYFLDYNDTWFGLASAYNVSDKFKVGISLFGSSYYMSYRSSTNTIAFSTTDTTWSSGYPIPAPVTEGLYEESVKFTDYRLIAKIGFSYVIDKWRFGLNITTPSLSLFSSGKESYRKQSVSNVVNPNNNVLIPGYVIVNGLTGKDIKTKSKYPFSVSFGFIYEVDNHENRLYFTMEYFAGIRPYQKVDAPVQENITSSILYDQLDNKDWLSVAGVANPVLNLAIGYRWKLNKDLMFLSGLRTDFNSLNSADYGEYSSYNTIKTTDFNIYHYNGGLQFYILKKHLLVAGGQLSYGREKNAKQMANFTDPIEYNPETHEVLQGPLENTMDSYYFGFNLYISATFNFSKE